MHMCTCTCACMCVCMSIHACVHVFITILLIISLTKGEDLFSCYKVGAIKGAITAQDQGVLGVTSHLSREMPPTTRNPTLSLFKRIPNNKQDHHLRLPFSPIMDHVIKKSEMRMGWNVSLKSNQGREPSGPSVWQRLFLLSLKLGQYLKATHTCDIVIAPEIHFDVVPLQHHTVLHAGLGDGHVHVVLGVERIHRNRLVGQRLMNDKIWE